MFALGLACGLVGAVLLLWLLSRLDGPAPVEPDPRAELEAIELATMRALIDAERQAGIPPVNLNAQQNPTWRWSP